MSKKLSQNDNEVNMQNFAIARSARRLRLAVLVAIGLIVAIYLLARIGLELGPVRIESREVVDGWAGRALVDVTLKHGGRLFLPYQLHYTGEQLAASYPELPGVLAKKRELDPGELFTSTFYRAIKGVAGTV